MYKLVFFYSLDLCRQRMVGSVSHCAGVLWLCRAPYKGLFVTVAQAGRTGALPFSIESGYTDLWIGN